MMIADIAGKPGHDRIHHHITRRLHSRFFISPFIIFGKADARKIMLGVEKISPQPERHDKWQKEKTEPDLPAEENKDEYGSRYMQDQRNQGIIVFPRIADKRGNAHAEYKHGKIPETNGERMPYGKVSELSHGRHLLEFLSRGNRIRPDARTE